MAAVILATQLSAQSIPSGDSVATDGAQGAAAGTLDTPGFFAALLAQQLGLGVGAGPDTAVPPEVIDAIKDIASDVDPNAAADSALVDALAQLQQGMVSVPVVPPNTSAQAAVPVEDDGAGVGVDRLPGQAIGTARGPALGLQVAEADAAGRQPFAAATAAFADAGPVQAFAVSAEALAEQVVRPATAAAPQAAVAASAPVAGAIAQPVSSPAWGEVLGDRVVWMVNQQQQGAELRLNPPSLGPLEIKLSMTDGQATLTFSTQHMPVKEALEAATPRLREMFGESGINLGSVSVNVGTSQQQQGEWQQANRQQQGGEEARPEDGFTSLLPTAETVLGRSGNGMVDFFA